MLKGHCSARPIHAMQLMWHALLPRTELKEVKLHQDQQRALHELLGGHDWQEAPSKHAECTLCGPMPASGWSCGAQRCEKCTQPPPSDPLLPVYAWKQHPAMPMPFFVIDQRNVPDDENLA